MCSAFGSVPHASISLELWKRTPLISNCGSEFPDSREGHWKRSWVKSKSGTIQVNDGRLNSNHPQYSSHPTPARCSKGNTQRQEGLVQESWW